jgi:predicted nucleic acid-binding protein
VVTYVFDTSALLRYLDDEAGAERLTEIIEGHLEGKCRIAMSAVNWGEVATKLFQRKGRRQFETIFSELESLGFEIVAATASRAVNSGLIKAERKIPYADAFGVDLASDSPDHVLITADFDVKPAANDIKIEFLPKK